MSETDRRSKMNPPLPCVLGLLLGVVCDWVWPWPVGPYKYLLPAGIFLCVLVGMSVVSLLRAFERYGTSADPKEEVTSIVDTGLFRFSRNPGYLAAGVLQVALGLLLNNTWVLLTIVPAMIIIDKVVVSKEEAYLEKKFGDIYLNYKTRVRRWI